MTKRNELRTVTGQRIKQLRNTIGWTQAELADRMKAEHFLSGWTQSSVAKIEKGLLALDVEELVGLAYVMGVAPAALLTPEHGDELVNVTHRTQKPASTVWEWMTGGRNLGGERPDVEHTIDSLLATVSDLERRYLRAGPDHLDRADRRLPGILALARTVSALAHDCGAPQSMDVDQLDDIAWQLGEIEITARELKQRTMREIERRTPAPTTKPKGTK